MHQLNQKEIIKVCLSAAFLVLLVISPLCANHWQFSLLLLLSVTVYFFFTSFTINASESHAGCFRYHTELSNIKAANTQCRKKIIKYDSFSGKNRLYCETNGLLSSALDKIFHTLNVPPALFCLVQNVDLRHFTSVSCSFHLYHAT